MRIERCLRPCTNPKDEPQIELHTFSDSSEFAYGAAVYAKVITDCKTRVALVIGKSRVAPLKVMSIPRLELTAAVVAAKTSQVRLRQDGSEASDVLLLDRQHDSRAT